MPHLPHLGFMLDQLSIKGTDVNKEHVTRGVAERIVETTKYRGQRGRTKRIEEEQHSGNRWDDELGRIQMKAFDGFAFLRAAPVIARILEGNLVEFLGKFNSSDLLKGKL